MSVTMSADAHTQMTNQINALGSEVRELKKQLALYEEDPSKPVSYTHLTLPTTPYV